MKTSVVMSEGLRNDSKKVYVSLSGILKKTINFHETLPLENEFLSKCRHYWRIKFGLFFMSASCCLEICNIAATTDLGVTLTAASFHAQRSHDRHYSYILSQTN